MSLEFNPETDFKLLLAVPLIPLAAYVVQIFFGRHLPRKGDWLMTGGLFAVMCITVFLGAKAIAHSSAPGAEPFFFNSADVGMSFSWFFQSAKSADDALNMTASMMYDPLGAAMLMVVGVVSFCVHLFSIGYMHGDKRYHIFFANISLFTVAMLGLLLSDNLLFMFIFWEVMGLMSYLLIGHFSQDPSSPFFHRWATWACKKAFLTTRVGDCLMFIGMFFLWRNLGTFNFEELWAGARDAVAENGGDFPAWLQAAGLCIFGGTIGKSAQFPLHIWLPDAMAGPTPVSAMIHAATMVAAGVFLLGRTFPLMSPEVLAVVTVIGAFTAIFAATIGMTVYDLKAVLAYSTISQLGFMVAAVGMGGVVAGMFHMVTHAFFKACLFLSAGSVIHGCHHVQDMRLMGGLRKKMPITFVCMLICTLAIAGVPFFSGFYSKDMIILAGWSGLVEPGAISGWSFFALIALALAAMMTAFYMFRLIFMTFFGEFRGNMKEHMYSAQIAAEGVEGPDPNEHGPEDGGHDDHGHADHHGHEPHESPFPIVAALCILAFAGMFGGHFWLADSHHLVNPTHSEPWFTKLVSVENMYGEEIAPWVNEKITPGIRGGSPAGIEFIEANLHSSDHALAESAHELEHQAHLSHSLAVGLSLFVAFGGIFLAYYLYMRRRDLPAVIAGKFGIVYETVRHRYYIDEMVNAAFIAPTLYLCRFFKNVDEKVIDGAVLTVGSTNRSLGFFWAWVDKTFVDGIVNFVGLLSQAFGSAARLLQTGRIQQYATIAIAGGLLVAAWVILA